MPLSTLLDSITAAFRRLFGGSTTSTTPTTSQAPRLLVCPNTKEERAAVTIGPEGGTLQLGEHRLVVPQGAVGDKVSFTAVLMADKVLKLHLQANGAESYQFRQPASLTLSYGRCEPAADPQRLRVYKIDPATNRVIQDLGGRVSVQERAVTATLETLSVYTLGTPT